jgi:hypothetical protein
MFYSAELEMTTPEPKIVSASPVSMTNSWSYNYKRESKKMGSYLKIQDLLLEKLNGANGMSDTEGKVTRVGASEPGQRTSFNGANGMSDIEGKAATVAARKCGVTLEFQNAALLPM